MNTPVRGLSGAHIVEGAGADSANRLSGHCDPLAAVAAHRALNSVAFIAGVLSALQQGSAISLEEREQLLSRAMAHTDGISALLHDLVLGLPLGATAVAGDGSLRRAEKRFGVRAGN